MTTREEIMREALCLIANGEWATDSSAKELAREALAASAELKAMPHELTKEEWKEIVESEQ